MSEQQSNGSVWSKALVVIGGVISTAGGWYAGVNSRIDLQASEIASLRTRIDTQDASLRRIESKLEKLTDGLSGRLTP